MNGQNKRGLPTDLRMRHEKHYVEELFNDFSSKYDYREVDTSSIILNEEQPRKDVGELEGLIISIKEKGVLEPILLRRAGDGYIVISGERRYKAAKHAGLNSIPAIILDVNDLGALEIALVENLQRKDLTPFEEADAYAVLVDKFNLKHEEIAGKIGKSRIHVTETITLSRIPKTLREFCLKNTLSSKSILIEIARIQDFDEMRRFAEQIAGEGLTRSEIRNKKRNIETGSERIKPFIFKYHPQNKAFKLNLTFKKDKVDKSEIIDALQKIIENLQKDR